MGRNWGFLSCLGDVVAGTPVQGSGLLYDATAGVFANTVRSWAIATTSTPGLRLGNTTAATSGTTVQYSPALQFDSAAWNTAASVAHHWRIEDQPSSGATTYSYLKFQFAKDAAAYSTYFTFSSHGYLTVATSIGIGTQTYLLGDINLGTGQAGIAGIQYTTAAYPLALVHSARTDGANNIVAETCYLHGGASVTNAATMRLHSFGITLTGPTYSEVAAVYCDGAVEGTILRTTADVAGVSGKITFTNASVAAGSGNTPTFIKVPGSAAAAQVGWMKIYVDTTARVIPYWAAA